MLKDFFPRHGTFMVITVIVIIVLIYLKKKQLNIMIYRIKYKCHSQATSLFSNLMDTPPRIQVALLYYSPLGGNN